MGIPPLALTHERATRLLTYIQTYRRYALTQIAPSTERNTNQRQLQALQGKLIQEMDKPSAIHSFALTGEEVKALHTMVSDLLQLTAREAASDQRSATLIDLTALKSLVEQLALYHQGSRYTQILL